MIHSRLYTYFLASALFLSVSIFSTAETAEPDTLNNRNITVEKNYQPVIQDVGRILSVPDILQSEIKKEDVKYLPLDLPLQVEKDFRALNAREFPGEDADRTRGYLDLAAGLQSNTYAHLALPIVDNGKTQLGLFAGHQGVFSKRLFSQSELNLLLNSRFKNMQLSSGLSLENTLLNYYGPIYTSVFGTPMLPPADSASFWNVHALIGLSNLEGKPWMGTFQFNRFMAPNDVRQNELKANFLYTVNIKNLMLKTEIEVTDRFYDQDLQPNFLNVGLHPYLTFEKLNLNGSVGFTASLTQSSATRFYVLPDIRLNYKINNGLSAEAGIGGNLYTPGLRELISENPYYLVGGPEVPEVYTPFHPYLSLNVLPFNNFSIKASADYKLTFNQYSFKTDLGYLTSFDASNNTYFLNKFDLRYQDLNSSTLMLQAEYRMPDLFTIGAKGSYTHWWNLTPGTYAWLQPAWKADFHAGYTFNKHISVQTSYAFEATRYFQENHTIFLATRQFQSLAPIHQWNIQADYRFNSHFTAFLKLNNLLNQHYQRYPGYDVQGFYFLLGGSVSL